MHERILPFRSVTTEAGAKDWSRTPFVSSAKSVSLVFSSHQLVQCFVFLRAKLTIDMNDFLENIIGLGSPDEGFRILLCMVTYSLDGGEQI